PSCRVPAAGILPRLAIPIEQPIVFIRGRTRSSFRSNQDQLPVRRPRNTGRIIPILSRVRQSNIGEVLPVFELNDPQLFGIPTHISNSRPVRRPGRQFSLAQVRQFISLRLNYFPIWSKGRGDAFSQADEFPIRYLKRG